MLTDFFIATPAEVQALDIAHGPSANGQCLRAKRTDPVKIIQLQCCIEGVPFEQRLPLLDEMMVRDGGEEGPWIFRLPDVLQSRLASASQQEIQQFGRAWAATEEWTRDGGTPDLIVPFLGEIAQLASQATAQQRSVFVWMCL
jgi:hypothetical protein